MKVDRLHLESHVSPLSVMWPGQVHPLADCFLSLQLE